MSGDPRLIEYLTALSQGSADIEKNLDGWIQRPAFRNGVQVGATIQRGPEMHMISFSDGKAMSRKNIVEHLAPVLDQYGYVTTRVPKAEEDHRLRTKLGFEFTWEDDQYTYWCLTQLPFQKG
jgi:hypothetical protein